MIFDILLIYAGISAGLAAAINIVGVSFYDIQATKHAKTKRLHPYSRQLKKRPKVTVVIETLNSHAEIIRTLDSLLKSNYRKLQVVLADNASTDGTAKMVRDYIKNHPKREIRIYAKRKRAAFGSALINAYRKHADGQIILRLQPGYEVSKTAITLAVESFNTRPSASAIVPSIQTKPAPALSSIFQTFSLILRNRARKANSLLNSDYFADLGPAAFYRRSAFEHSVKSGLARSPLLALGDRCFKLLYAAQAEIYAPSTSFTRLAGSYLNLQTVRLSNLVSSWRLLVNRQNPKHTTYMVWFRYPLAITNCLTPAALSVVVGYFVYLAFWLQQPSLLLLTFGAAALVLFFAVLEDDCLKLVQKLRLWILMPVSYSWFALLAMAQWLILLAGLFKLLFKRSSESAA